MKILEFRLLGYTIIHRDGYIYAEKGNYTVKLCRE